MPVSQRRTSTAFLTSCQMHGPIDDESYSSGLLVCMYTAIKGLCKSHCAHLPIPPILHLLSKARRLYSCSTVSNYLTASCVAPSAQCRMGNWNSRNGGSSERSSKARTRLVQRKPRQPYTPEFIAKVGEKLDLNLPLTHQCTPASIDSFYSVARVGNHSSRSSATISYDQNGWSLSSSSDKTHDP